MYRIDVLCVGASSFDLVFQVDHHPLPDEKTTADGFIGCGGGPAANASIMVARMGLQAAFAGYLGLDLFGRLHLEELRAAGVNTDLVVRGEDPTPVSCVLVKPTGERSLVNYRAADPRGRRGSIATGISPRVMLFDGHEPDLSLAFLTGARERGIRTVLDAGSLNRGTALLFDRVEYPVCSERFACDFTGTASPEAALDRLNPPGRCVVVTLGEKGVLWKRDGKKGRVPAFPVRAVDTTGAGDVFHGAFAGSLAVGNSWDGMLAYACAAAALCCTRLGARTGIPTGPEVDRFLGAFRDRGLPPHPSG